MVTQNNYYIGKDCSNFADLTVIYYIKILKLISLKCLNCMMYSRTILMSLYLKCCSNIVQITSQILCVDNLD